MEHTGTMDGPPRIFDRELLMRRLTRARAAAGGAPDFLLRRVAEDLLDRLAIVRREFPVALDLGLAAGVLAPDLARRAGTNTVLVAGPASVETGDDDRCTHLEADEEALPFVPGSLDLVVSALSLQFVNDLPGALAQIRIALKSDGLLLAAVVGGATLTELRQAWLAAEVEMTGGASPRVAPFADVRDLGGLLQRAGFALPVADSDVLRVTYETPLGLMQDVRAMGASNCIADRRRVPVTRRLLLRAAEIYAERFALPNGRIPATFEIITLTAWAPHESQPKPLAPGSATARLADALGVAETKLERE